MRHCSDPQNKNEKLAETSALLLALIIRILNPLPFFHTQVAGLVNKLLAPTEPYADLLSRLLQSGKREHMLAGLSLASAAVHTDKPDPHNLMGSSRGRLASKVWAAVIEGGGAKALSKMFAMRRRNKEGAVEYGDRDPLDRPDIRHLAIHLVLPLLPTTPFHTHAKQILPALYSGLALDPPTTVYRVLNAMWAAISGPPPGIARRIALVLLDENAVDNISKLLDRGATEPETGVSVGDMAAGFLEGATATPGRGICFPDEGWYPREEEDTADPKKKRGLHNRILSNVVKRLGARVVDDEGRVGAWVLKMFKACPELVGGYWAHSALSLEPRLDARWIATMAYVGRVISLPLPDRSTFNQPGPRGVDASNMPPRATPPAVLTIIESVLPSPLTKSHLSKGLQHANALVQHVTALALARALQKLDEVQALFNSIAAEVDEELPSSEGAWAACSRELEAECRRRVPEVPVIIAFAQKAATMARPNDEDDEIDPALAARSAMLTEAALRLFGLYHKALPSLAGEARFDVGKLLVSASSANAERGSRREAREGSVVSDSGSVGSVGTLGTVGMGGGFGHSRGNVEGFEALSQLHVLRLLSEVRDWSWTKKAAGSQYTYLYHIIQLRLSTHNVVTQAMTTTLLERLLTPSLLFEHDSLELPIWLDALPRVSDTVSGPMFIAQQIHLLSFFDECVRRALKTPHRYIEEAAAVVPDWKPQAVSSPLLLTMVEQLHAKLLGMHIATEAAAVVLNYLRRVMIGLLGKQSDGEFVSVILARIGETIKAAHDAGQPRHGLEEIARLIGSDFEAVFDNSTPVVPDPETPRLVDEADWAARSFVRKSIDSEDLENALSPFVAAAGTDEHACQAQFLVHLLGAPRDTPVKSAILRLVAGTLRAEPGVASRLKSAVFNDHYMREFFLTADGAELRVELSAVADTLRPSTALDHGLAEQYAAAAVEALGDDTPATQAFEVATPWVRFMLPAQVDEALASAIKRCKKSNSKKEKNSVSSEISIPLLSALVRAARPESLLTYLSPLLSLGCYDAVSSRLRSVVSASLARRLDIELSPSVVADLVKGDKDDAYALLSLLVSLSASASSVFTAELEANPTWLQDPRILPAVAASEGTVSADAVRAGVTALESPVLGEEIHAAARKVLIRASADDVNEAIKTVQLESFGLALARTASALAKHAQIDAALATSVARLLDLGLQWATEIFASGVPLAGDEEAALTYLTETLTLSATLRIEPDVAHAEALISAAVSRLSPVSAPALDFAAILTPRTMLKAGFIRAQLTDLLEIKVVASLSIPSAEESHRQAFMRLTHALFVANTYVSAQPSFIEPLVGFYRGTLAEADRLVLGIFAAFESQKKISVASILRHWAPGGANSSGRALDALTSLDAHKVFATCAAFPLRRSLAPPAPGSAESNKYDAELYDPVFILCLLSATLQEEITPLEWVEILRTNVLGLTLVALSSRDKAMRSMAGYLLKRTLELIEPIGFHEKLQLLHTLELVAHAIDPPATSTDTNHITLNQSRIPTLITLFLAHAVRSIAYPGQFIYPLSSRFLLQRPILDIADVPLLYGMLYASGDAGRRERAWIVRLLRDGVRSEADYRLLARRNVIALLATLFSSSLDVVFRRNVLSAILSIVAIPSGARAILRGHVPWLKAQWDAAPTKPASEEVRDGILAILEEAVRVVDEKSAAEVARVLAIAAQDADAKRLRTLARIAFRLAPNVEALPALVDKLQVVPDDETTELLFRVSLNIATMTPALRAAVTVLSARVATLHSETSDWARQVARSL